MKPEKEARSHGQNMAGFIFFSRSGGMHGSGTALSDTVYIARDGSVQVSREETSGVLHDIRTAITDTGSFFKDFESVIVCTGKKQQTGHSEPSSGMVSEYYPPEITLCHSVKGTMPECFTEIEGSGSAHIRKIADMVDRMIRQAELIPGQPGLYIRSQMMPESFAEYVRPDIRLKSADDIPDEKARFSVLRTMSFVYAGSTLEKVTVSDNVSLMPDRPVYVLVGERQLYLLTAYRFR